MQAIRVMPGARTRESLHGTGPVWAGAMRRACLLVGVTTTAAVLSGCGHGSASPKATVNVTSSAPASSSASPAAAVSPAIVAVTTAGALVTLDPASGTVAKTLVPSGVEGDEISVSSTGMVYFAIKHGCSSEIEAIPVAGGAPAVIAAGSLPAVSPDGTKLAYASQPSLTIGCVPSTPDLVPLYKLEVRTLSSGSDVTYPMVPAGQGSNLPAPIFHLSWAPDNNRLAVSIAEIQDNEGMAVYVVDTSQAQYYLTGTGTTYVPVTGQPSAQQSYLREGVFTPNGDLFVSRACCGGLPPRNTSRLMWEVTTSGTFVHQVAIGFANLDHTSLGVSADGNWLLYLAANDLYLSHGGATPRELATGFIAAAWS